MRKYLQKLNGQRLKFIAQVDHSGIKKMTKILFSTKGRINRKTFLLSCLILLIIYDLPVSIGKELLEWSFLKPYIEGSLFFKILTITLSIFYGFLFVFCLINLTIKRLHDLNKSGWHFLASLIPIWNIYLACVLYFKRGTNGSNRFGADPLKEKKTDTL